MKNLFEKLNRMMAVEMYMCSMCMISRADFSDEIFRRQTTGSV